MARPTLLVIEPDPIQALSVRKLVLETAKFNVLTAHSQEEALEIARLFPAISAIIVAHDRAFNCEALTPRLRRILKNAPMIAITARIAQRCNGADHHVSSHEPEKLLELVRSLLGDPRDMPSAKTEAAGPRPKTA
jgi:CheY-like chemotaxis protein